MKKIFITTAIILIFASNAYSQCAQIVASPASASCNVSYNFNVTGNLFGTTFDFNSGQLPAGWDASPYLVSSPCNTKMIDNSNYFWATKLKNNVRYVKTNPLNVSNGGSIEFYMRYGSDDPDSECEDPDLTSEGVFLQYSTNNGSSWTTIKTWTPRPDKSGPLYSWNKYSYSIPVPARTTSTRFRWYQPENSGEKFDNWGLDNIKVSALTNTSFLWNFGDGVTSTAQNPSHTYTSPGVYTVSLQVTGPNCNTTVYTTVTIAPGPSLSANITHPTCPNSTDGSISLTFQNATAPITYSWTPSSIGNTNNASNLGVGTYDVNVVDANNCIANTSYELISQGSVPPIVVTKDISINLNSSGNATITPQMVDNGSYSTCGDIASITLNKTNFNCSDVGVNTVTLTVTNVNGYSSDATANVTVIDAIAPVVATQNINVDLDASGNAIITAAQIDNGSTDACGISSLVLDKTTFDCSSIGVNTVILTVTDVNGNYAQASAEVTIIDNTVPTAICQDITIQLDANGEASIVAADVDGGSNDACGISSISVSPDAFNCANIGANIVTLTVTDNNGNSSTCEATVTLEDNVAPIIAQLSDIEVENDSGVCGAVVEFSVSVTDNCDQDVTVVSVPASGSFFEIGTTVVNVTATDDHNNVSTTSFTVTVLDTEAPIIEINPVVVELWPPNHEYQTITAFENILSVSDNCDNLTIGDLDIVLVSSDEPENGSGDGDTYNDIVVSSDCKSVDLRSERKGDGNGRAYSIEYSITDSYGNTSSIVCQVNVPQDIEENPVVVKDTASYIVASNCSGLKSIDYTELMTETDKTSINAAIPNPMGSYTEIQFTLSEDSEVSLSVYGIDGKLVNVLLSGKVHKGKQSVIWHGTDIDNNSVPNGIYMCVLKANDYFSYKKILVVSEN